MFKKKYRLICKQRVESESDYLAYFGKNYRTLSVAAWVGNAALRHAKKTGQDVKYHIETL